MVKPKPAPAPELWGQVAAAKGPEDLVRIAKTQLQQGNVTRGKAVLEVALENDKLKPVLSLVQSCLLLGPASVPEAVAVARQGYSRALAVRDEQLVFVHSLGLAVALGHQARLITLSQQERQTARTEALALLEAALSQQGTSVPGTLIAQAEYVQALLHAEAGHSDALLTAERAFKAAIAQPDLRLTPLCLSLLALLLTSRQQHKAALKVLSAASQPSTSSSVGADPAQLADDVLVSRLRAKLFSVTGDQAAAVAALAQCKLRVERSMEGQHAVEVKQQLSRLQAEVLEDMAVTHAECGQARDAAQCLDQARQLQGPWSASLRCAEGRVAEAVGDSAGALACYSEAVALDHAQPASLTRLGVLESRKGSAEGLQVARDLLRQALRYDPASAAAWYRLGLVSRGLGHHKEAEAQLLTALKLAATAPVMPYSQLPLRVLLPLA